MSMKLTLLPLQNDEVVRIRCDGRITLQGVAANGDPLETLLGPHCYTLKVLMSLQHTQGIDTSGVSWLMREIKKFEQSHGRLVLYAVPPVVVQMLDFLRLTPSVPIASSDVAAREWALTGAKPAASPPALPGRTPG
jgi:anti-anti-sigma regulatory factor